MNQISFNKIFITGNETAYMAEAMASGKIAGDGKFTRKCQEFFERKYGFRKCLLTTSCTDALEMAALLLNIQPGDEVIIPSYTFVSTANAFILRGAKVVFADSNNREPNLDPSAIEKLITPRTKAIVVVHYAGVACDMDIIMELAEKNGLFVIEDAAQAIDSFYKGRPLGSIGHLSAFSFHETKNIICGEGGMLVINDERFMERAEIIREKGTNRSAFLRGEKDRYEWVDAGSSFLPSDLLSAFLFAQLESLETIQQKRREITELYLHLLKPLQDKGKLVLPCVPAYATNNASVFYVLCKSREQRQMLIDGLKAQGISAVFHYLCLHRSKYYSTRHDGRQLPNSDRYTECLLRLPLYTELSATDVERTCNALTGLLQ
jgi:dTDP-4-amino-4,6-dideoxygalactose transaminase